MMIEIFVLRFVKIIIVVLGVLLVYLGWKSYKRSKAKEMVYLSLGFASMTVGSVVAGVLFEFLGFELLQVSIVESAMMILGFLSVIYSIYGFD